MDKELEALNIIKFNPDDVNGLQYLEAFKVVEQAILELKAIKEANLSKAMKCLKEIHSFIVGSRIAGEEFEQKLQELAIINQALLKAQGQENTGVIGGRTFGKDILYLKQSLEQCNDKPIFYISRTYGNKYIVPQKQFDDLANENTELKRVLEILFKKQVDLGWLWYCVHECVDSLNEYNKKMPIEKFKLTQEEFNLVKEWSDWIKN